MEPAKGGLDLEKELTCSICTEVLYQPLTLLDCLHTFCGSCLKEWFTSQLNTARKSPNSLPAGTTPYTCPSCRAPVRDTKHNATVTTLLEMYLATSPEKGKTNQEKAELEKTYKPGDGILPKLDSREMTLRERMVEDEDRALINEVRDRSLREAGVESSEARRQRRRREEGRSHEHRARTSIDNSRENRESRTTEDRERRRRREAETERRQERVPTEERRRRRSDGESRRRHEEARQTTARQVEHQSSLRSLISSSDIDSREMEEEILRQIREEGLLDGIDLENIDVNQEDDISERIAEAFRRRQNERARHEQSRRSDASGTHSRTHSRSRTSGSVSNTPSRDTSTGAGRRRTHSRSPSSISQSEEQSRPPPSISAIQASHLEVQSSDESRRRRRRTTSSSRNSTPAAVTEIRAGSRSQTDLNDRPRSINTSISGPSSLSNTRSSTDPIVRRSADLSSSSRSVQEPQPAQPTNSAPTADTSPRPQETSEISSKNVPKSRAPPPGELPLSNTSTSFSEPLDRSLLPLPLSPRAPTQPTLADRANALSSGSRPTSSSSSVARPRPEYFAEPSIMCAKCGRSHIEYELHYNCGVCSSGHYNICLDCYRAGKGCLYWFGFGYTAFAKWESKIQSGDLPANAERPHMLHASRYVPPRTVPGGAEGRRTLTTDDPQKRLQSGVFCANCLAWTNECYWRCDVCNDGDWGFCNLCVNQGRSCTHPLLPLTYKPSNQHTPPLSPSQEQKAPPSASILTGPNVVTFGSFKPLTFLTTCDVCHSPIQPSSSRFHCFCCISRVPNTQPGDYDICTSCYPKLVASRRISVENGPNGWRRCLRGHRMIIAGFEDSRSGQRRIVVRDIVGGRGLIEEPAPADQGNSDLMLWSWGKGVHISGDRSHKKLVTKDVMKSVPAGSSSTAHEQGFPPDGGVGMKAVAIWGWYPTEGADDELLFPKGAEVRECKDVNTDWFYGTYMGKSGLFQANYVRVLDTTVS